jgi:hypothetical protein
MSLTANLFIAVLQGPPFPAMVFPHELVEIIQSVLVTVAVIALGIPLMRAFTRRFVDRPPLTPVLSTNLENRLERIEQAVEAVAIEVERIAESQRYLTKVLAEPRGLPDGASSGSPAPNRSKDSVR